MAELTAMFKGRERVLLTRFSELTLADLASDIDTLGANTAENATMAVQGGPHAP